jgi:hypothetical protein
MMTPGDYATLTEEMEHLGTQDYMGAKSWRGINDDDDENHYPFPLVRSLLPSSFPFPLTHHPHIPPSHPSLPFPGSYQSHPTPLSSLRSETRRLKLTNRS